MAYEKQVWRNGDPTTPLSEDRLNHIEDGIFDAADRAENAAAAVAFTEDPADSGLYTFPTTAGA